MQIFVDSADIKEIIELNDAGIIDGVTTNPALIAKSQIEFLPTIKEIAKIVSGPVSAEVVAEQYDGMITEGLKILDLGDNIIVKLPCTWDGIRACKYFTSQGRGTNLTLCFSANQALLAAKAGATYISPFIGRLDDYGHDGLDLIGDIVNLYDNYELLNTKVLAASVRNTYHVSQVSQIGADVATMPAKIIKQLVEHPLTSAGVENFVQMWNKAGLKI